MIHLREEIFVIGFFGVYMIEKLIYNECVCYETWYSFLVEVNSQKNRPGVQKMQELFTNLLFMTKTLALHIRLTYKSVSITHRARKDTTCSLLTFILMCLFFLMCCILLTLTLMCLFFLKCLLLSLTFEM